MWLVIDVGLPCEFKNQGFHVRNFLHACDRLGCVVSETQHHPIYFACALWLIDNGWFHTEDGWLIGSDTF